MEKKQKMSVLYQRLAYILPIKRLWNLGNKATKTVKLLNEFGLFMQLPLELRYRIWDYAIADITPQLIWPGYDRPYHALLDACHDSRYKTLKVYKFYDHDLIKCCKTELVPINLRKDIIEVYFWAYSEEFYRGEMPKLLTRRPDLYRFASRLTVTIECLLQFSQATSLAALAYMWNTF